MLASEICKGTRTFLVSVCEASNGFFHGVLQSFLQIGLPFRNEWEDKGFFGDRQRYAGLRFQPLFEGAYVAI